MTPLYGVDFGRASICAWNPREGPGGTIHPELCSRGTLPDNSGAHELRLQHIVEYIAINVRSAIRPYFIALFPYVSDLEANGNLNQANLIFEEL